MRTEDEAVIPVQREWNGWRTAEVRLRDLKGLHWFQPSSAPRELLHGYVSSDKVTALELPHEGAARGNDPLLVCVLKSHTLPAVYSELVRRASRTTVRTSETA
jgi:hypothetical protein